MNNELHAYRVTDEDDGHTWVYAKDDHSAIEERKKAVMWRVRNAKRPISSDTIRKRLAMTAVHDTLMCFTCKDYHIDEMFRSDV